MTTDTTTRWVVNRWWETLEVNPSLAARDSVPVVRVSKCWVTHHESKDDALTAMREYERGDWVPDGAVEWGVDEPYHSPGRSR